MAHSVALLAVLLTGAQAGVSAFAPPPSPPDGAVGALADAYQFSESTGEDTFAETIGVTSADAYGAEDSAYADAQGYANGDDDSNGGGVYPSIDDGGGFAAAFTTTDADAREGDAFARSASVSLSDDDAYSNTTSRSNSFDGGSFASSNSLATGGQVDNANPAFAGANSDSVATGLLDTAADAGATARADFLAITDADAGATSGFGNADAGAVAYSRVATVGPINPPIPFPTFRAVANSGTRSVTLFGGDANANSRSQAFGETAEATSGATSIAKQGGKATNLAESEATGK